MELTEKQMIDISYKILDCLPKSLSFKDFALIFSNLIAAFIIDFSKEYKYIPDKDMTKFLCDNIKRIVKIMKKEAPYTASLKSNTNT